MLKFQPMISLAKFFELNHQIILFIYGLVFFLLGFAVLLQVRRSSRLELARSLRWLAAFGITHAFHEWGDLFIPIQAEYLGETVMQILRVVHLILLACSFAFLFQFGVTLLHPSGRARWLNFLAWGLLGGWFLGLFFTLLYIPDPELKYHTANALARYFIGFPGGLLAGYGLRVHTLQRIKPLNVPDIVRMLRVSGFSLGVYAVLGGLIPPPISFFPGNILNTATFTEVAGIPPWIFRSLISTVIAVTVIRALEIFDLETERRVEALEQQQIIAAEHERLARELHDGAIQKVYTAGLLVESASRLAERESEIGARLQKAVVVLSDSIADLRRNLAELHGQAVNRVTPLSQMLADLARDPHYNSLVNISLELELDDATTLSPARSGHVLAIANEALSNTVRHAHAQNVRIEARDLGERLEISIRDNGIGISPNANSGYGLRNMRDRARLLNGTLKFASNKGTVVTLEIPWND